MKNYKFNNVMFYDGLCNFYVLRKNLYTPQRALEIASKELEVTIDELYIEEGYCRYLVKTPEDMQYDFGYGGVYTLVDKKEKGAFEVYVVYIQEEWEKHYENKR